MASGHSHAGHAGSSNLNTISPLITSLLGAAVSMVFGLLLASLIDKVLFGFLLDAPDWVHPIAFWTLWFGIGEELYRNGHAYEVPVGYVAVPKFLGARLRGRFLSEGQHWLFPLLMGLQLVNLQIQDSNQRDNDDLVSKDGILMRGRFFFVFQVTDPFTWLSVEDPEGMLLQIAESEERNAFAEENAMELATDTGRKKGVAARMDAQLQHDAHRFGVDIIETKLLNADPPKAILDATANKQVEIAQREAEKTELDGVIARIRELKIEGFSPEKAYEIIGGERGKVKTERKIFKVEGVEPIVDKIMPIVGDLIKRVFKEGASS